ncbi:MAG: hypothetical protein UY13_C0002G0125 [Candidatus Pacebacteria bacterium GW2011_GWB1_47_8]|nr:MAG: hypothetical protein UX28_C0001G0274 [Candidatus Pacebacteria bacterium GW2011_GWA1_46_10]KKU84213.1 MAG: hypothetical protein UY13_C0002G0125 [Candidatus Pacebacteria bacterium GW2011_GWB1_47_8]HCR81337.1 hypothetical protein [Candidatus Paceibacterota bacterium]
MGDKAKKAIETRSISLDEVIAILSSNKPEELIGVEETAYFECRGVSYLTSFGEQSDIERHKFNLVKDVVSIANSGGGVICIGVKTLEKSNEKTEYITEIAPVPKDHIQMKSWEDILFGYSIPKFKRQWLKYGYSGTDKKVFWIKIADIRETAEYPVLVSLSKKYEEGVSTVKENFGLYFRDRSVNVPYSPEKLHTFIQAGFRGNDNGQARYLKSMLEAIDTKIDLLSKKVSKEDAKQIKLELREEIANYVIQKLDSSKGLFYLFAFPVKDAVIKEFWEQGDKSVYHLIKNTPHLRETGWDLRVAQSEYPYPNKNKWEITNGNRKLTSFDIRGRLFSAGSIDGFLNWGVRDYKTDEKHNIVNAFALTEYIDSFFQTLEVFKTVFDIKSDYEVEAGFLEAGSNTKLLFPPHIISIFHALTETIKQEKWDVDVRLEDDKHPSYFAGQLIQEIYVSGFGYVSHPDYPYLTKDDKGYKVNEALYIRQK